MQKVVYKQFRSLDRATELFNLLKNHGLDPYLSDDLPPFDVTFSGNNLAYSYEIQLDSSAFQRADELLQEQASEWMPLEDEAHYLKKFTDQELIEVIQKIDEWSVYDRIIARKLLVERGQTFTDEQIKHFEEDRIKQLSKPEKISIQRIVGGYIAALSFGFVGILIGYAMMKATKTLPNGNKVFVYDTDSRFHGKIIFTVGIVILLAVLIVQWQYQFISI
ncbi:MAG: hypothetical protein WDZ35_14340 [Crocinitomicaceae bacterium]